jgi:uncharacterized phage protein (TIGR01671 family)
MRPIKFRAWNKKHNIMVSWEQMKVDNTVTICFGSVDSIRELMQFTGLKDKNGKEIYEGDIIGDNENNEVVGEIVFYENSWRIQYDNLNVIGNLVDYVNLADEPDYFEDVDVEVIGNIYENSNLTNPV